MTYYRLIPAPIRTGIVTLDSFPEHFAAIDAKEGLTGQITTFYPEALTDFIASPIPLVSDALFTIFRMHQTNIPAKFVSLEDPLTKTTYTYWTLKPKEIPCLAPETKWSPQGKIIKLVLEKKLLQADRLFTVSNGNEALYIAQLAVVESMLRRGLNGFEIESVQLND